MLDDRLKSAVCGWCCPLDGQHANSSTLYHSPIPRRCVRMANCVQSEQTGAVVALPPYLPERNRRLAMGVQIATLMLGMTLLGALVGACVGLRAWSRMRHYPGESGTLLFLLGHHLCEPALTGILVCLGGAPLAVLSIGALLLPWGCRQWTDAWLRSQQHALAGWGMARLATCVLVWVSIFIERDLTREGTAPVLAVMTIVGTAVFWMSVVKGWRMLAAFPVVQASTVDHRAPGGDVLAN
jgi:hypothetical protein